MIRMFKRSHEGPPLAFALVWLIYMAFPVSDLITRSPGEQLAGFIILFVFAGLYLTSYMKRRRRLISVIAQLAIVGYFAYRYHENFLFLAFYPSPLIGLLANVRQMAAGVAALLSLFIFIGWQYNLLSDADEMLQLFPALLIMLIMPIAMRIRRRSGELQEKLSEANEEIARLSKNEERQRISRDLHDTLGHTLSLITLKSELAEKLIVKNPERAAQEIRDVQMTSRAALRQVRELVSGMNAVTVRDEVSHAKQILAAAGIELKLQGEFGEKGPNPAPLVDNMLGMCLREAVTNIVKHSRARSCSIEWVDTEDAYFLTVTDDGIGANPDKKTGDGTKNGIRGMRERLNLVEGVLTLESEENRGTRVRMTVPRVTKSGEKEGLSR